MYQTDFDGYLRDEGCLFSELVTQVEIKAGVRFTNNEAIALVNKLHRVPASYSTRADWYPVVSNEQDRHKLGAFVWDHPGVCNAALDHFGLTNIRVVYTGRIYMPWEEARGKVSFGVRAGDFCILQIRTTNGNGHFRGLNHDPWQPATQMADLKSIRYYRFVEV